MGVKILIEILFSLKKDSRTRSNISEGSAYIENQKVHVLAEDNK